MIERPPKKVLRCAIYTRKSSEEGLEQDFNSLHAQREVCEAFVISQKHEGWKAVATRYDDGGYSGGSMQRPALQKLLADIQSRLVDVVVVYKVDRLTRALSDFSKIVEVFDAQGVSFVSVTQQFNTTSSMGRLTLNVLLSFAQFEREVTGERIRDKIAASKKKGMWMGGFVPIGYDLKDRSLHINKAEAETVRAIFRLYLDLGNVRMVQAELERRKLKTKRYLTTTGRQLGGLPFRRGHIYWILSNPIYVGEIGHKGARHAGQHPAIIDRKDWDAVQARIATVRHKHRACPETKSILAGLLFDHQGQRLTPTNTKKKGRLYRYYADLPPPGRSAQKSKVSGLRISASEIEQIVLSQIRRFLCDQQRLIERLGLRRAKPQRVKDILAYAKELASALEVIASTELRSVVVKLVRRVNVEEEGIQVELKRAALLGEVGAETVAAEEADTTAVVIDIPASFARRSTETRLVVHDTIGVVARSPDPALLKAVARAHVWFEELSRGRARSITEIADREGVTDRYVAHTINVAFTSPALVEGILEGRQAPEVTVRSLMFGDMVGVC